MTLDIQEGSRVSTADGSDLGKVRQFVIRPSTSEVTHVLLQKGVFFTEDRVVPVKAIDRVEDGRLILSDVVNPNDLPLFIRDHYAPVDEPGLAIPAPAYFLWRHPIAPVGPFPEYPDYQMPDVVPDTPLFDEFGAADQLRGGEIIGPRAPVLSTEGKKLGTVSEVHLDESGQLSYLVIDLGFLNDEKVLPAHWISSIGAEGIRLAVSDQVLETLETIT